MQRAAESRSPLFLQAFPLPTLVLTLKVRKFPLEIKKSLIKGIVVMAERSNKRW